MTAARRLLALVLLAAAALVAAVTLTRDPPTADAEALVIAQRLDVDVAALPRYAEAVFHDGQVEQTVRDQLGLAADHEVIPERVSLIAAEDSIVLLVKGHDHDPQTAVDLANGAADAFAVRLNAVGQGVGDFAVQSRARTATTPPPPGGGTLLPMAFAAGLTLVGVLLLRRPTPTLVR